MVSKGCDAATLLCQVAATFCSIQWIRHDTPQQDGARVRGGRGAVGADAGRDEESLSDKILFQTLLSNVCE